MSSEQGVPVKRQRELRRFGEVWVVDDGERWLLVSEPRAVEDDPPASLPRRPARAGTPERKLRVWVHCLGVGTAYGATCGALFGTFLIPLVGTVMGAGFGALLGLLGGCAAGLVGNIVGGVPGWLLAGVLGGLSPAVMLLFGLISYVVWPIVWISVLIGGFLGLAAGRAVRSGRSSVPGVQKLADLLNEGSPPRPTVKSSPQPGELVPARAPAGRGDEATPAAVVLPPSNSEPATPSWRKIA